MTEKLSRFAVAVGLAAMMAAGPALPKQLAAGSGTSVEAGSGSARVVPDPVAEPRSNCSRCGERTFGTSVQWESSVPEAARRAQAEEKLVFVLHVSGHFENAGYT